MVEKPKIRSRQKEKLESLDGNQVSFTTVKRENETAIKSAFKVLMWILPLLAALGILLNPFSNNVLSAVTKSDLPLITDTSLIDKKAWSTYRSHTYFGLKARHEMSPNFGMMWFRQPMPNQQNYQLKLRHWCYNEDSLKNYAWLFHDGKSFGEQRINDDYMQMNASFIGNEHSFSTKVSVKNGNKFAKTTVIYYFGVQGPNDFIEYDGEKNMIDGRTDELGDFSLSFDFGKDAKVFVLNNDTLTNAVQYEDFVKSSLIFDQKDGIRISEARPHSPSLKFIAVQVTLTGKGSSYTSFKGDTGQTLDRTNYDTKLKEKEALFEAHFESRFHLSSLNLTSIEKELGRVALSNMLGGISDFYGSNIVHPKNEPNKGKTYLYGPHNLLTAVPSRSFFPRGFLWDEAFHNILIRKFDPQLSFDILSSWFDTINKDGWIPREMILGEESLKRVPSEFVVQRDDVANPPAFFYLMDLFLKDRGFVEEHMESLKKLHPRMRLWFKWLMSSQKASKSGLFRWRGRLENLDTELNPKTLASGLDDYPRATNPTHQEYHLDLKCWMMMSSQVMSKFDKIVNTNNLDQLFEELGGDDYSEYSFLKENHWDPQGQMFADYGLHSTDVYLKQTLYRDQNGYVQSQTKREFRRAPKQQFVTNAFGYVNLFPLLLKQIPPNAPELEITLKKLGDGNATWSKYGLRSVSKTSPYYGAKNTEHDPGYWRGYIWINLNYMALSALNHYGSVEGPYREMSLQLFTDLRTNIINLISNEYNRTGYVFENYDDSTGMGQGTRPFNGWSSLVLVIMSGDFS